MADNAKNENGIKKKHSFWDSSWAFAFLVVAILLARFYVVEPFKIPSGSMEPTLIGHENYGDRIIANKLAYATACDVALVMLISAAIILGGFIASKSWRRLRSIVITAFIAVAVLGGMGCLWLREAIAGEFRRFDVVVFKYETKWINPRAENKQINYIKRLIGLPGEKITISGGNFFRFDSATGKDKIIRMWESNRELQESLWYPVAKAWAASPYQPLTQEDLKRTGLSAEDMRVSTRLLDEQTFPWNGATPSAPSVKLNARSLELDGASPVELTYKHQVRNVHIKHGRWPFRHLDCPAAHLPPLESADGVKISDPRQRTENITSFVANTWDGVQCPNCKQVMFPVPILPKDAVADKPKPYLEALQNQDVKFFYSSYDVVGDLKLEIVLDLTAAGGVIEMDVGSNLHHAKWVIPSNARSVDAIASDDSVHAVSQPTEPLAPGVHTLVLAYLDATVIASLDGREIERRTVDVEPIMAKVREMKSVARVAFNGVKGRVSRLDLFRNLIHIPRPPDQNDPDRDRNRRVYDSEKYSQSFEVPQNHFLMLGDNGPSSADGRVWGFVPKQNLMGRASFIWWPASRWRIIR
ncbi:MAG: signal peptidase I [Planctomycetota bacterium]